ncbi:MAG: nucleotidyltransferase family protein [Muribaculaceae bacterium]|nr:nucleotidyltransferase family protein [Muribaculaceae bacterium]
MKALIFAAGLGTRLRPLTNDRPKAMVEIAGKPMLQHVIERVAAAGFDDITINIHHFGQTIIDFLEHNGNFGLNIHISDERGLLLDTGGGILKARQWLDGDEPFLVHNTDIISTLDLKAFYDYHVEHDALATILVKERVTQRYFLFDENDRLRGWTNKATGEVKPDVQKLQELTLKELAFGGLHVISPRIFPELERYHRKNGEDKFSIVPFYIKQCSHHLIQGYQPQDDYLWLDIGKPDTLAQAEELLTNN